MRYKVGDAVICTERRYSWAYGETGIITSVEEGISSFNSREVYRVHWDRPISTLISNLLTKEEIEPYLDINDLLKEIL